MPDKSPAFQFYPRDFLADSKVILMSLAAVGVYIKLLCLCWLDGGIPVDPRDAQALVGWRTADDLQRHQQCICATWETIWAEVIPCFVRRGDQYVQLRVEAERQKQTEFRDRQRRRGQQGAAARWAKPKRSRLLRAHSGHATFRPLPKDSGHATPGDSGPAIINYSGPALLKNGSASASASASAVQIQERAAPDEAHARDLANSKERALPASPSEPAGALAVNTEGVAKVLDTVRHLARTKDFPTMARGTLENPHTTYTDAEADAHVATGGGELVHLRQVRDECLSLGCDADILVDAMLNLLRTRWGITTVRRAACEAVCHET